MTNYASMAKRIRFCLTDADFERIEQSLERVYKAGAITVNEFSRLDSLIVDCRIANEWPG